MITEIVTRKPKDGKQENRPQLNIVDLLTTEPSGKSFEQHINSLCLPSELKQKAIQANLTTGTSFPFRGLTREDENHLSTEVLLLRHRFTNNIFRHGLFRQAAITVIQNIYLFQQRKIYFATADLNSEQQRQDALRLLTNKSSIHGVPLAKTFQHLIICRIWNRINFQLTKKEKCSNHFAKLHSIVEQLNTIRNIYIVLTREVVKRFTRRTNPIYSQSITTEDAHQIGIFGIARASYRYHSSTGIRFSTFAGNWVAKEIQRQSLANRLIRLSSTSVEKFLLQRKDTAHSTLDNSVSEYKEPAAGINFSIDTVTSTEILPDKAAEKKQLLKMLRKCLDRVLSQKQKDILLRKYGLKPYVFPQSVIHIARHYGVTRGSIYQLEQKALKKLRAHFRNCHQL